MIIRLLGGISCLSGSPTYNGMMKARTLPEMHCETFLLFLSFRLVSWDISVWFSMSRFHDYYWLSLCNWLVGWVRVCAENRILINLVESGAGVVSCLSLYVQRIKYCIWGWSLYNLPPPPSTQGPWSSPVLHHVMYTLLGICLLSWIFLFQLGKMIKGCVTWDETTDSRVKKRGRGSIFVWCYLVVLLPVMSSSTCFWLAS